MILEWHIAFFESKPKFQCVWCIVNASAHMWIENPGRMNKNEGENTREGDLATLYSSSVAQPAAAEANSDW